MGHQYGTNENEKMSLHKWAICLGMAESLVPAKLNSYSNQTGR